MNLNQVTLPSLDIPKSVQFYRKLGLKLIVENLDYARFECPNGDSTTFIGSKKLPEGKGTVIYF